MATRDKLDDSPITSDGDGFLDAREFYSAYLKSAELAKKIPKTELSRDDDFAFYRFVMEVHSSKSDNPALFRQRPDASEAVTRLWLSRVREKARLLAAFNRMPRFLGLTTQWLADFAKKSLDVNNIVKLESILREVGIVLVYEPSIAGLKLDGAAFQLGEDKPVVALSLRYSRLDNFWFTLMHELAHIAIHRDVLATPILDDLETTSSDLRELQADRLASDSLIPRHAWRSCQAKYTQSPEDVAKFAAELGVHPAIVAGRLRRELDRHDLFADFINAADVREILLK